MPGYRPLVAWRHFRNLIKDKENTEEVFHIFEALPWKGVIDAATAFLRSERGQAIRASEPYLPDILDDHAALRAMPAGSLAHAYCDFMEAEGLSAKGLVDEFDKFKAKRIELHDQVEWYFERMRDTHDLAHVLTGFGRDALGEQCVLAFTYGQQPSPAHLFIGYAGAIEIKRGLKVKAPVLRAVREGQKMGKACPRLCELPIRELLPLPIAEVRARLGIGEPSYYREVHATWRAAGVDPFDLLKKAA
ncbi:MAG: hypothetical protein JSS36_11065 [Proteobacteria bacterium]|nr:hypothetical protein [Pseudomonadota bacterium]